PAPPPTTLPLHDALPIYADDAERPHQFRLDVVPLDVHRRPAEGDDAAGVVDAPLGLAVGELDLRGFPEGVVAGLLGEPGDPVHRDRKSTRLNSSHEWISY